MGIVGFLLWPSLSWAATYKVDPDHTTVSFKIRHLFSKVQGVFNKFEGTIDYEPGKPEVWKTSGSIDTASINTNVAARDTHLKSADFFDVEKYPSITFKSKKLISKSDGYDLVGDLTIKDGFIQVKGMPRYAQKAGSAINSRKMKKFKYVWPIFARG